MFESRLQSEPRSAVGDWAIRITVCLVYVVFGMEKFRSDPGAEWVKMFHQIGWGDWFRYFTGAVEVLGGLLVLIPSTARVGLVVLGATMAGAVGIVGLVLNHPGQSLFPGVFLAGLVVVWFAIDA